MADLHNFQKLAATVAPKMNVSVSQHLRVLATHSVETYSIEGQSAALAQPVKVEADSEAEAVRRFGREVAQRRRAHDVQQVIGRLKADYSQDELDLLRERLTTIHYGGYDRAVQNIVAADAARYDAEMGAQHEQQGYSDGWAHNE